MLSGIAITAAAACVAARVAPWFWFDDPHDATALGGFGAFTVLILEAFRFHIALAMLPVLLLTITIRRWRSTAVIAITLASIALPALNRSLRTSPRPNGWPTLTVLNANTLFGRADAETLALSASDVAADVVVLLEVTQDAMPRYISAFAGTHPHVIPVPGDQAFGPMILSAEPYVRVDPDAGPRGLLDTKQPLGVVDLDGREIAVRAVHLVSPGPPPRMMQTERQRKQAADLAAWAEGVADALIVAGDLNAPFRSKHLRELREAELLESHDVAGRGRGGTWPMIGLFSQFPPIRLDHIMFSEDLRCIESGVVRRRNGSDHAAVFATFECRGEKP